MRDVITHIFLINQPQPRLTILWIKPRGDLMRKQSAELHSLSHSSLRLVTYDMMPLYSAAFWQIMFQDKATSLPPGHICCIITRMWWLTPSIIHIKFWIFIRIRWPVQMCDHVRLSESPLASTPPLSQHQFKIIVSHYSPAPHYKPYFTESHFRQKIPTLVGNERRKTGQEVSLCVGYLTRRRTLHWRQLFIDGL